MDLTLDTVHTPNKDKSCEKCDDILLHNFKLNEIYIYFY